METSREPTKTLKGENMLNVLALFSGVSLQQGRGHAGPYQQKRSQRGEGGHPSPRPLWNHVQTPGSPLQQRYGHTGASPAVGEPPSWPGAGVQDVPRESEGAGSGSLRMRRPRGDHLAAEHRDGRARPLPEVRRGRTTHYGWLQQQTQAGRGEILARGKEKIIYCEVDRTLEQVPREAAVSTLGDTQISPGQRAPEHRNFMQGLGSDTSTGPLLPPCFVNQ